LVLGINPTSPVIAPGTYTAAFTTTATDGNVPGTYTASVTYTVTLNVVGSLTATAANSLFTYVIGTSSTDLPLVIASQPSGVIFNITTSTNLASSIPTGATPNTPQITVNGTVLTSPVSGSPGLFNASLGVLNGSITVTALNSALNCPAAQVSTVGSLVVCSVTVPFTLDVHDAFFQGETSVGGGFYNLPNTLTTTGFGTYAYFANQTSIFHTTLGILSVFPYTDATRGVYLTDQATGDIWYTSPTLFPYIYDFTAGEWLQYSGTGGAAKGTRVFTNTWTFNTTSMTFVYTGKQTK
jgi:hypothetical protein